MYPKFCIMAISILATCSSVASYSNNFPRTTFKSSPLMSTPTEITTEEPQFSKILLSGFISKAAKFSEPDIFNKVFAGGSIPDAGSGSGKMFIPGSLSTRTLIAVSDDLPFARKRLVSPKSVYSGLIDAMHFSTDLEASLTGQDAWIAYNVSSTNVDEYADLAVKSKVKRIIFAIHLDEIERRAADMEFNKACSVLQSAGIDYTLLKYGDVTPMAEAKFPYRVVRGALPLPSPEGATSPSISSGDLCRILSEVLSIPKTYGNVYGLGPGTKIDSEILVYMKSQGWPERVQVGLLVGDMMEKIEKMYEEEAKKKIGQYTGVPLPRKSSSKEEEPNYLLNI